MNFQFYSPTKIFFGKGEENNAGKIISEYGYKKILLHYGKNSIKASGLYDKVVKSLKDNHIDFVELGGVEANPKIGLVREGVKLCKAENVEMVLSVGGGSVIDSGKAIACGTKVDFDPWQFSIGAEKPEEALPVGVILTISAAGSEMSPSCVISNPETKVKNGFTSDLVRPRFAIENPELTYSVSKFQTACGVVDIMMHTLERYLSDETDLDLTAEFCEGLLRNVLKYGKIAVDDHTNYKARSELMISAGFSHNNMMEMGSKHYFTVHKLEHQLSGLYDEVAHGAGLSVLFFGWAKYVYKSLPEKFAALARNVMGVDEPDDLKAAEAGLERLKEYFVSLGMPVTLKELGVGEINIEEIADRITKSDTAKVIGFVPLDKKAVFEIYKSVE
ncbi:MAG: iron-containing alcohol dehydrogenase [Firmicutes bacterium]|nr:iron-containing alcohol dehydrogenase [Bacillota bacterium]